MAESIQYQVPAALLLKVADAKKPASGAGLFMPRAEAPSGAINARRSAVHGAWAQSCTLHHTRTLLKASNIRRQLLFF
jgi:hypothetical protein